jgi:LytS/YehU family sensor histidine kinase
MILLKLQETQWNRRKLLETRLTQLQLENISNQIDPHFTLNMVDSIVSLKYVGEVDKADKIATSYSKLLRSSLNINRVFEVPIKSEIDMIRHFCEIESERFHSFSLVLNIPNDVLNATIPRSFLFEFVQNAIKHGMRNQKQSPCIRIEGSRQNNSIILTIEDNGPGLTKEEFSLNKTNQGFKIAEEAALLFKKLTGRKITFEFESASSVSPDTFSMLKVEIQN